MITQRCDKSSNSQKHQQVSSQWAHAECKFPGAKLQQSSDSFDSIYGTPWNSPVNGDLIMLFIFHEENALKLFFSEYETSSTAAKRMLLGYVCFIYHCQCYTFGDRWRYVIAINTKLCPNLILSYWRGGGAEKSKIAYIPFN